MACRVGSLLGGIGFAIAVPSAVITCGGRAIDEAPDSPLGSVPSAEGGQTASDASGGSAGGQTSIGTDPSSSSTSDETPIPPIFPTATATSYLDDYGAFSPFLFLGAYQEPNWPVLGVPVPTPSVSVNVPSPCVGRVEVCNGRYTRRDWARALLWACESQLGNCGIATFSFSDQDACAHWVNVYGVARPGLARCVATLTYHTSCIGSDSALEVNATSCSGS